MAEELNPQAAPKPQYFNDPAVDALYQMVLLTSDTILRFWR